MFNSFNYAYRRIRGWYVDPATATLLAARYALTGDTGAFRSHGGMRMTRLRLRTEDDED